MDTETSTGFDRRTLLKRGAITGGALVWATPVVQSLAAPAHAASFAGNTKQVCYRFKLSGLATSGCVTSGTALATSGTFEPPPDAGSDNKIPTNNGNGATQYCPAPDGWNLATSVTGTGGVGVLDDHQILFYSSTAAPIATDGAPACGTAVVVLVPTRCQVKQIDLKVSTSCEVVSVNSTGRTSVDGVEYNVFKADNTDIENTNGKLQQISDVYGVVCCTETVTA